MKVQPSKANEFVYTIAVLGDSSYSLQVLDGRFTCAVGVADVRPIQSAFAKDLAKLRKSGVLGKDAHGSATIRFTVSPEGRATELSVFQSAGVT
jgi:hypothetical protein